MADEESKKNTTRENIVSILMTSEDMDLLRSLANPNGKPLWQLVKKGWLLSVKEEFLKAYGPEKFDEELRRCELNSTELKQESLREKEEVQKKREEKTEQKRKELNEELKTELERLRARTDFPNEQNKEWTQNRIKELEAQLGQ